MKTRFIKSLLTVLLLIIGGTVFAEDFATVYFHDGTHKKFFLKDIEGITISKKDVNENLHDSYQTQLVETKTGLYYQDLSQIDSVVFSQVDMAYPIIDEDLEATKQLASSICLKTNDIVDSLESSDKLNPVLVVNEFMKIPGVVDAVIDDDLHSVTILRTDSIYHHFIFNDAFDATIQQRLSMHRAPQNVKNQKYIPFREVSQSKRVKSLPLNKDEDVKNIKDIKSVLILAPFENMNTNTGGYPNDMLQLSKDIKELLNVKPVYLHDEQAVISNFKGDKLDDYDMIIICTHGGGGRDSNGNRIDTKKAGIAFLSISTEADLNDLPEIRYASVHGNYNSYLCMTEQFLDNASFDGSVVFSYACSGFDRDYAEQSMTRAFIEKNASSYFGSKVTVYNWLNENVCNNIVRSFCDGVSLQDAVSYWKNDVLCSATHFYLSKLSFIDYDYPLGYFPEALELETKSDDPLYSKSPIPNNLNYDIQNGSFSWDCQIQPFSYKILHPEEFPNEHFPTYDVYVNGTKINEEDLTEKDFKWTPETSGTFNWYVLAKLKSKMGVNDYMSTFKSKEESFTIQPLELSSGSFCINEGKSTTIDITSGNGEYDIFNGNHKVTTVTLEGEKIKIDAIGAGESTIIVTDKKTGEEVKIEVTVWANLSIAIIGNIDLEVGASANVRIMSGNNDYTLDSDKPEKVKLSLVGEFITVEALSDGKATITVTDNKTGQTASFTVTVTDSTPVDMPAAAVDLGLPSGTLWANKNVGAASPENGGLYFAWGEIVGYGSDVNDGRSFDWDSYKWDNFTKYCSATWVAELGMGIVDNKTILDPEDDAATANWGENWRMPTYEEFKELLEYTTSVETTLNGENGRVYKSLTNDNSIFLPYTGYRFDNYLQEGWASYWSSTQVADKPDLAYKLAVDAGHTQCGTDSRVRGFLVRPVFCGSGGQLPTYDNLQLSTYDPIIMNVNAGLTFMILSGSGSYAVGSSKETVATATLRDNYVDVSGVGVGTATITVIDTNTGQKKTREVTVIDNTPLPDTPAEAIDLGLPSGTLWASCNVGATKPEEYGGYYSWGEIVEKDSYEWSDYLYCEGSINTCKELGMDIAGTQYDIAHVKWGGDWRMPTYEQQQELVNNTKFKYTTSNGIKGYELVGPNGNSIFLPASGIIQANRPNVGSLGGYWSSTRDPEDPNYACNLLFRNTGSYEVFYYRCIGLSVRPVISGSQQSVPNLVLESTAPLNLKARQKTGINIISGSGSYTVKSDDESVATADISDWVSLETGEKGKCVNVNAVGLGLTTITVTDVQSLQQVSIEVTVTQNVDLLKLSVYSLDLKVGETGDVVITSSSGAQYLVATNDASVATFSLDKTTNTIKVLAVGTGTCNITVNDSETGETATVNVTVVEAGTAAAAAIDLGLPSGTKWADRNVGASSPEDFGGLYPWAMTEEVEAYGEYKWGYGEYGELTKYCTNSKYGTVDNKTVLDPEDDVAYMTWGSQWRMPTLEQAKELIANCNSEWTTLNGVRGRKYTSKINGNSIFIPAAGYFAYETYYSKGSNGFYWLSTLDVKNPERAYDLYLASSSTGTSANFRYHGNSVRPVTK